MIGLWVWVNRLVLATGFFIIGVVLGLVAQAVTAPPPSPPKPTIGAYCNVPEVGLFFPCRWVEEDTAET